MLNSLFLIGSFGTTEMLLIVFAIILLFGAKRIPELFRGMGQGVREFKDATKDNDAQFRDQNPAPPVQPPYNQQYPQQPYQNQPPYPQQPQPGYGQPNAPQQGYPQQGYPQQGYQQAPPAYTPNDPNQQRS
jgi:TatA/E family protein of Tat protein translocase